MKRGGDRRMEVVLEQVQGERAGGHVDEEVGRRREWAQQSLWGGEEEVRHEVGGRRGVYTWRTWEDIATFLLQVNVLRSEYVPFSSVSLYLLPADRQDSFVCKCKQTQESQSCSNRPLTGPDRGARLSPSQRPRVS